MPALVAGIHAFLVVKTWMAGTSPAMTTKSRIKSGASFFAIMLFCSSMIFSENRFPLFGIMLSALLHPEFVHMREHEGIFLFEGVPVIEIALGLVVRKLLAVLLEEALVDIPADEFEIIVGEEALDSRQRQPQLMLVEQKVAAIAQTVEIRRQRRQPDRRVVGQRENVLAAAADLVGALAVTALGDELPRRRHFLAGDLAVKPDMHEAAGPQDRYQPLPGGERVGHVMHHAGGADGVEFSADRGELQNIGLGEFDVVQAEHVAHALGIAETGAAEVDREHPHALEDLRHADDQLAGAAARDQEIGVRLAERLEGGIREFPAQKVLDLHFL